MIRRIATVVGVLAVLSAVLTFVGQEDDAAEDAELTVVLSDFEFDKPDYEFTAGSKVLVRNDDPFMHSFSIESLDIDEIITPGSSKLITIPESGSGDVVVFCRPHTSDPAAPEDGDMYANATIN